MLLEDESLRGKWVAYHCDERIGVAASEEPLVQECLRRGLKRDQYEIFIIQEIEEVTSLLLAAMINPRSSADLRRSWIVSTPDGVKEVKPYQILVFVSITARSISVLPEDAARIPAILDTGNNHNFCDSTGTMGSVGAAALPQKGRVDIGGSSIPRFAANIWIHPNRTGTIDPSGESAFMIELEEGIIVYPSDMPNPARLPILGLRGIIRNGLKLTIDGATRALTLESPPA